MNHKRSKRNENDYYAAEEIIKFNSFSSRFGRITFASLQFYFIIWFIVDVVDVCCACYVFGLSAAIH